MKGTTNGVNCKSPAKCSVIGTKWQLSSGSPTSYIDGFQVDWVTFNSYSVGPGLARDINDLGDIVLTATITPAINVSGVNGLDTGTEAASTWYHLWIIGDPGAKVATAAIYSLSPTSPTMPTGYTLKRRIASVRNDAGLLLVPQRTYGMNATRDIIYVSSIVNRNVLLLGGALVPTAVALGTHVPPTSRLAFVKVRSNAASGTNIFHDITQPIFDVNILNDDTFVIIPTTASQQIGYSVIAGGASSMWLIGYKQDF